MLQPVEKWKGLDKQCRKTFAKAVEVCRQVHEVDLSIPKFVFYTKSVVGNAKRKQKAWSKGHDAWETALKLANETLAAWEKIVDHDASFLKKRPNVKRLEENVKCTQEIVDLAIDVTSNGSNESWRNLMAKRILLV
ncbi:hypothetical protein AGMMS49936_06310 [Endomicrobiia bacterium]|nr:hypothetical protein AGMMS49936_06310 [Endomicrobiia bacterium]